METTAPEMSQPAKPRGFSARVVALVPGWIHPNHVTYFRFLGSAAILVLGLAPLPLVWLVVVGLATGFSDNLDGAMARHRKQETELGALLDPLADKLMALALFIVAIYRDLVDWRVLALAAAVDLHAVALPVLLLAERRKQGRPLRPLPKVRPIRLGKIKTAWLNYSLAIIFIGAAGGWDWMVSLGGWLIWGAVALGLVAGARYFALWRQGAYS